MTRSALACEEARRRADRVLERALGPEAEHGLGARGVGEERRGVARAALAALEGDLRPQDALRGLRDLEDGLAAPRAQVERRVVERVELLEREDVGARQVLDVDEVA